MASDVASFCRNMFLYHGLPSTQQGTDCTLKLSSSAGIPKQTSWNKKMTLEREIKECDFFGGKHRRRHRHSAVRQAETSQQGQGETGLASLVPEADPSGENGCP